jgi:hypothetical protein
VAAGFGQDLRVQHLDRAARAAVTAALIVLAAGAAARPAAAQTPGGDPSVIHITACTVTNPKPLSHKATGTRIAYVNTGPTVLHAVTFEVGYTTAGARFTRSVEDVGLFAPNTPVDHHFALYQDVVFAGNATSSCKATRVR